VLRPLPRNLNALRTYPYKRELARGVGRKWFPMFVKYPIRPRPRFGQNGSAPNPHLYELFNEQRETFGLWLERFLAYSDDLHRIQPLESEDGDQPWWGNTWFSGLDAVSLYGMLATLKPSLYIEIGSGNSTKFARRAVNDHALDTRIISIDPYPRSSIDELSDEVIRSPLEDADLSVFERLKPGDILFIDSSHHVFMNSDVTVLFLEVLPRIPPGVMIHVHDIYLPYDYPVGRQDKNESEQYLIAAMLLGGCAHYSLEFSCMFVSRDPAFGPALDSLCGDASRGIPKRGASLWMSKHEPARG